MGGSGRRRCWWWCEGARGRTCCFTVFISSFMLLPLTPSFWITPPLRVGTKKPPQETATKKSPKETAVERLRRLHPEVKDIWEELKTQSQKTLDFPLLEQPAALVRRRRV